MSHTAGNATPLVPDGHAHNGVCDTGSGNGAANDSMSARPSDAECSRGDDEKSGNETASSEGTFVPRIGDAEKLAWMREDIVDTVTFASCSHYCTFHVHFARLGWLMHEAN